MKTTLQHIIRIIYVSTRTLLHSTALLESMTPARSLIWLTMEYEYVSTSHERGIKENRIYSTTFVIMPFKLA